MAHDGVFDVCEALLVQPVFLNSIVNEVERGVSDKVGGSRLASEEGKGSLPCGAFCSELV